MVPNQIALKVTELSQAGEARRRAATLAHAAGFSDTDAGRLAVIVTEAARNLANHAREGEIILRAMAQPRCAIEVITVDRGPGMASSAECLRDGYSSAGTSGTGLGAIRRMSNLFDIYTQPEKGTVLLARVDAAAGKRAPERLEVGVISLPIGGEEVCGDQWSVHVSGHRAQIMVADGLGHGRIAYEAAHEAVQVFQACGDHRQPREVLERMNLALRATRGAAVGIAELQLASAQVLYHAIGNVAGAVITRESAKQMAYLNGTVGRETRPARAEFTYPFPRGATLVMHSDGLATWHGLEKYPGVLMRHPAILAALLYRDLKRPRDDVTVLAVREAPL